MLPIMLLILVPEQGIHGGEVVAQGTAERSDENARTLSQGSIFSGKAKIPVPNERRRATVTS